MPNNVTQTCMTLKSNHIAKGKKAISIGDIIPVSDRVNWKRLVEDKKSAPTAEWLWTLMAINFCIKQIEMNNTEI